MKKLLKTILVFLTTCSFGLIVTWAFVHSASSSQPEPQKPPKEIAEPQIVRISMSEPLAVVSTKKAERDNSNPLDEAWTESEDFTYNGYRITRACGGTNADNDCSLIVFKQKKRLAQLSFERMMWVKVGLFDFLGKDMKQLIVYEYSGGAHCCYDYTIYELDPYFRKIYDSKKLDSVGNELVPVDIDHDGVYEFTRSVMALTTSMQPIQILYFLQ